jgi:thioredoxin-dependent peroxiredoxin
MAVEQGEQVPDFEAPAHDGRVVRLSDLLAVGPVVVFFYPKARTAGCTAQACHFRDLAAEFAALGAQRVGVSRDDVSAQSAFVEAQDLDFPLLADVDGSIARIFGAKRPGPLWSRRMTAVVDRNGTLLGTVRSEHDMEAHADQALAMLRDGA